MPNSLGLDDDLDPVEALLDLEQAFALKIDNAEASRCETVGDIFDVLHSRFAEQIGKGGACMTSMAFYRLRKGLRAMHPGADFRPTTPLASFAGPSARKFLDRLRHESGLRLPRAQARWLSGLGCLMYLGALGDVVFAVTSHASGWFLGTLALVLAGMLLVRLDPGALPPNCATLGDLAMNATVLNFGRLAQSGAAVDARNLWDSMAEVLSQHGDRPIQKTDIRRDTFILEKQLRKARS